MDERDDSAGESKPESKMGSILNDSQKNLNEPSPVKKMAATTKPSLSKQGSAKAGLKLTEKSATVVLSGGPKAKL